MGVKPETIKANDRERIKHTSILCSPEVLERGASGKWYVTSNLALTFTLRDGRVVSLARKVRLPASQDGKKPNPNPFGRKSKGRKRK